MSQKKLRILPVQTNNLDSNNNLLDIHIPKGGIYDVSKSYVSIIGKINSTTTGGGVNSVHNLDVVVNTDAPGDDDDANLDAGNGGQRVVPSVALVKNAVMISENKGMMENIRDVNKLRVSQASVGRSHNQKIQNYHTQLGGFSDRPWGYISPFINAGANDYGAGSIYTDHEVRIPLSDIFETGKLNNLDTNYLGDVHIHLEMDMSRVRVHSAYKPLVANDDAFTKGTKAQKVGFGVVNDANTGGQITSVTIARDQVHSHEADVPWYIGQTVEFLAGAGTVNGAPPGAGAGRSRITAIGYGATNVSLTLDPGINGGAGGIADVKLIPTDPATKGVTFSKVELVLFDNPKGQPLSDGLEYTTYTTEKDSGGGSAVFNRQYETEPEAVNLLVHMSNQAGGLRSTTRPEKTRVSINNENTTNRDVGRHTPLQLDRLQRYYLNSGDEIKSLNQGQRLRTSAYATNNSQDLNTEEWIYEPLPQTGKMNLVDLSIEATATVKDITLFKEVVRVI